MSTLTILDINSCVFQVKCVEITQTAMVMEEREAESTNCAPGTEQNLHELSIDI